MTKEEADKLYVTYYMNRAGVLICCDLTGCADPYREPLESVAGVCPACGAPVDKGGQAVTGCHYSPVGCKTCGHCPCNQSC